MARKPLLAALLISLAVNVAVVAGFVLQRYREAAQADIATLAATLRLSESERSALIDVRRAVFADVRKLRADSTDAKAELRTLLATHAADAPELAAALARIADERDRLQADAIRRLIAFRDRLSPEARARFNEIIQRRGFLLALFGVSGWGLPEPPPEP